MKKFIWIIVFIFTSGFALSTASAKTGNILIDPGHSPKSPGTISCTGKPEYVYNAALANKVSSFLSSKKILVDMTHRDSEDMNLVERTSKSNHCDLLLSLHHDSVQPQFLSRYSKKRGYCSEKAKGFSIFVSRKNPYYEKSVRYAKSLGTALVKRGLTPTMHHAEAINGENRKLLVPNRGIYIYDELVILKNAKSPALLLEAAVIVNPNEDLLSDNDRYRHLISEAIYEMLIEVK